MSRRGQRCVPCAVLARWLCRGGWTRGVGVPGAVRVPMGVRGLSRCCWGPSCSATAGGTWERGDCPAAAGEGSRVPLKPPPPATMGVALAAKTSGGGVF